MDQDSTKQMKKKFLALHDYGTGGIWRVILARSAADIKARIPGLAIFDYENPPKWIDSKWMAHIEKQGIIDIDGPLDDCLNGLVAGES